MPTPPLTERPDPDIPDRYEAPAEPVERESYRLQSDDHATWAMRRLRDIASRRAQVDRITKAETARLQQEIALVTDWRDTEYALTDRDFRWFEGLLTEYAARVRQESDGKRKSVSTPWGKAATRETGAAPMVTDPQEFVSWAWDHADRRHLAKETIDIVPVFAAIKEAIEQGDLIITDDEAMVVTPDGETVPGLAVQPTALTVKVTPTPPTE